MTDTSCRGDLPCRARLLWRVLAPADVSWLSQSLYQEGHPHAHRVLPGVQLEDHLERLLGSAGSVYFDAGEQRGTQPCQAGPLLAALTAHQQRVQALHPMLHSMR